MAIIVSDKTDFKSKNISRDKKGHYTLVKVLIKNEHIINIYTPKNRLSKYMRQKLTELKGEIGR